MPLKIVLRFLIIALVQLIAKALEEDYSGPLELTRLAFDPNPQPGSEDFCRVKYTQCKYCCAINQCQEQDICITIESSNLFLSSGVVFTQVLIVVVGLISMVFRAGKFLKYNKLLEKSHRPHSDSIEES